MVVRGTTVYIRLFWVLGVGYRGGVHEGVPAREPSGLSVYLFLDEGCCDGLLFGLVPSPGCFHESVVALGCYVLVGVDEVGCVVHDVAEGGEIGCEVGVRASWLHDEPDDVPEAFSRPGGFREFVELWWSDEVGFSPAYAEYGDGVCSLLFVG